MLPRASRIAVFVNPANTVNTQTALHEVEAASRAMGLQIQIFNASTSREIDAAFAAFGRGPTPSWCCCQLPRFGQSEPCSPAGTLPMPLKTNF